ncbi:MAG: AAA family ATPase, partial [Acidimicrobiia bacterium]|nr:AAA family ATPase [Acidimicrobiia bacterium]
MLTHPILDQLLEMKLIGMHRALTEQLQMNDPAPMSFEERLGLLI